MSKFNQSKYIQSYIKEKYIRKEVKFKKEEWANLIEPKLKKDNITLKQIILDYIDGNLKKDDKDN